MALKIFLEEINDIVKDIINTNFEFTVTDTTLVPSYEDPGLTFENGETSDSVLDGFTITNGMGSGIYCTNNSSGSGMR